MYGLIFGLLLALVLTPILSYPPTVPPVIVSLYDYPIVRLLSLLLIGFLAYVLPEAAIILGIAYAILSEDIMKTTRGESEAFHDILNLVPHENDVDEAKRFIDPSSRTLENAMSMVKRLETELNDISRLNIKKH